MLHNEVIRPPVLTGDEEHKIQQLHRYLQALAEQLQNVFDSIEPASGQAGQQRRDTR